MGSPDKRHRTQQATPESEKPAKPVSASAEDMLLVQNILSRDESAMLALVRRHHAVMVRVAQAFVPSPAIAEEVAQETWLAVLEGLSRFEGRSSLRTWLFQILVNRARTRGSREMRSLPMSSLGAADDEGTAPAVDADRFAAGGAWARPPVEGGDDPESVALRGELRARLVSAMEALSPRLKLVVTLRDVSGMSTEEVCNVLGITETHQRVLLHRARSKLRAALEPYLERRSS